ncbi:pur operon repressor [Bacillus carboniphilus]|uniref:Pur operon repressor n=1 Tax=Bacillus carboniphilus TaxID=86663 RepID=A0ABY9JRA0_9BACI|nr:pur operon repressor [Bacillus carboniphilus]WLR41921.1 pur operon repressor [Bacillus carboniphilus]
MKFRRSGRLVDLTNYLLNHPQESVPLTFFSERYQSAKSSISEDLAIIKQTFQQQGIGTLITASGAAGGVKFIPKVEREEAEEMIRDLCELMEDRERILPGGYLYLMDIIGRPDLIKKIGRLFASVYADKGIDYVVTVATKGIPIAYAVAELLNVPVVVVRRDSKITEGSTVSINYLSGSSKRIQTMLLSKRSLKEHANVLIIDDFMKAGGTINGMNSLLEEFQAEVVGIGVLMEVIADEERLVDDYVSLLKLEYLDSKKSSIRVNQGNYFLNLA